MPCFRPVTAWRPLNGGAIVFYEMKDCREIKIRCGHCIGCRRAKQEAWAVRCYAESRMHQDNMFLTLTYDDEHLPKFGSLQYRDVQLFLKRFRKQCGQFRFFCGGEYGDTLERAHYHVLVFGHRFDDCERANSVRSRSAVYRSATLERLWPYGYSSIGDVTVASARYAATYCIKKITGERAAEHYQAVDLRTGEIGDRVPEFARMSLKPGLGRSWFEKYWKDVYLRGHNGVAMGGSFARIPAYFDDLLASSEAEIYEGIQAERIDEAMERWADSTPERLAVREVCAAARLVWQKEQKR